MKKEEIDKKLIRYFAGECGFLEKREIEAWINENSENKHEFENQKNIWEKVVAREVNWDVDSSWQSFAGEHSIYKEEDNIPIPAPEIFSISGFKKSVYMNFSYIIRVAAVLLIIAGGYFTLKQFGVFNESVKAEIAWNQTVTAPGEKFVLTLNDSSRITLNADTKLNYPVSFNGKTWDVYLEGEAYFEIQHDLSKPFIVHTKNISTTVLGTKFNVSAFPGENNIAVSLVEGKVNVSKVINGSVEGIVELIPNQQLIYSKEKEIGRVEEFDLQKAIGWKENNLVFESEKLSNVFVKLERAYGVKFELADQSYGSRIITADFKKASLWTVVESIKKLTDLKSDTKKENNVVKKFIFYKK